MSLNIKISVDSLLNGITFGENDEGFNRLGGLIKSVGSQKRKNRKPEYFDALLPRDISFTDHEIIAAAKRYSKKNSNNDLDIDSWARFAEPEDIQLDKYSPFMAEQSSASFWMVILKAMLGIVFPTIVYSENYNPITGKDEDIQYVLREYEIEAQKQIIADLYIRKFIRIYCNEFAGLFKIRVLLSIQIHLKEVLYEYFDIVFSLKEEVVLKARFIINFITTLLFTNDEERRNFKYIPATCRT